MLMRLISTSLTQRGEL